MTYKKERLDNFNSIEFVKDIERRYGRKVACNVASSLLRLSAVSMNSNYLSELSSPRFVIRLKLHPITGGLIVETIGAKTKEELTNQVNYFLENNPRTVIYYY